MTPPNFIGSPTMAGKPLGSEESKTQSTQQPSAAAATEDQESDSKKGATWEEGTDVGVNDDIVLLCRIYDMA